MAQTGYTPILIYSSSTGGNAPAAGNLTNSTLGSELAINITDGKLFYKDNANAIQVIGWKTVPTSAGGTGLTSYTAGDLLYYATGTTLSKLSIGAAGNYLSSSGSAPQWNAPASLTKTDDTNVTLTLGGSASTALLNAASLTLGWTGTLAVSRGGTGTGTAFTAGSVIFAGASGVYSQNNAQFFWDNTNYRLGLGTASPDHKLHINGAVYSGTQSNFIGAHFQNTADGGDSSLWLQNTGKSAYLRCKNNYSGSLLEIDNGTTTALAIFNSLGVSIGNTTDPGATNLSVNGQVLAGATGYVGVGTTRAGVCVFNQDSNKGRINFGKTASGTATAASFNYNGTGVGEITYSDTATAYVTSSDYRLKENIKPMQNALDVVSKLNPVTYTWKSNGSNGQGFIAHELQQIVPDCVVGTKDDVEIVEEKDEVGNVIGNKEIPKYQGIDTSFLVATLTAAIQELQSKLKAAGVAGF